MRTRGARGGRSAGISVSDRVLNLEGSWSHENNVPLNLIYCKNSGPSPGIVNRTSTILEAFFCFFTLEVWNLLAQETNSYAARVGAPSTWYDTYIEEMKAFIGMLIIMGISKLPRLEMYWSVVTPDFAPAIIRKVMPRSRFMMLLRFLHVNSIDPSQVTINPNYDRLYKVRKLLDIICPKFESAYTTHQEVSIDEAMIPFQGRLSFKQYMKDKPTKWGIKAFVLCDARNGYCYRMQIYTGKNVETVDSTGLCSRVVLDLLEGFEHSNIHVYMDNYYSSPNLYFTLAGKGIGACGTARSNRKNFPKELITKATVHNRGKYDYRCNGCLLGLIWVDKRSIYMITTIHPAVLESIEPTVKRRKPDGSRVDLPCPPCLPDYQSFMRGVDRADQRIGYYNLGRRSKKWWKRVFAYLIECCFFNSFVLLSFVRTDFSEREGSYLSQRITLAKALIGDFSSRQRIGRPPNVDSAHLERLNLSLGHFPQRGRTRARCVVCSRHNLRHDGWNECSVCEVSLCGGHTGRSCFKKYHTLRVY